VTLETGPYQASNSRWDELNCNLAQSKRVKLDSYGSNVEVLSNLNKNQTDRKCWSISIQSDELSWVKRRTYHELKSSYWSSMFGVDLKQLSYHLSSKALALIGYFEVSWPLTIPKTVSTKKLWAGNFVKPMTSEGNSILLDTDITTGRICQWYCYVTGVFPATARSFIR